MKRLLVFALLISFFTACDDNDDENKPTQAGTPTAVNYAEPRAEISEQSGGFEVVILLSKAAAEAGIIEVQVSEAEVYGSYFSTDPAPVNEKIVLTVTKGDTEVSFRVLPVNNAQLNGNKITTFSIVHATGSVTRGESVDYTLTLVDDELLNKPFSFETEGVSKSKNTYEYNVDGLLSKVIWEARGIHGLTQGTDTYYYDNGKITHIDKGAWKIQYTWEGDHIIKVEHVNNEGVSQYTTYNYGSGTVTRSDSFIRTQAGEYELSSYTLFVYHEDGNIHQVKSYFPEEDEFVLNTTRTYDAYIDGYNSFPLTSIFPNHTIQAKLPTYYSIQTKTALLEYAIAYELTDEGYPTKREISGPPAGAGVTTFSYY